MRVKCCVRFVFFFFSHFYFVVLFFRSLPQFFFFTPSLVHISPSRFKFENFKIRVLFNWHTHTYARTLADDNWRDSVRAARARERNTLTFYSCTFLWIVRVRAHTQLEEVFIAPKIKKKKKKRNDSVFLYFLFFYIYIFTSVECAH